jgi:hypothetical protein
VNQVEDVLFGSRIEEFRKKADPKYEHMSVFSRLSATDTIKFTDISVSRDEFKLIVKNFWALTDWTKVSVNVLANGYTVLQLLSVRNGSHDALLLKMWEKFRSVVNENADSTEEFRIFADVSHGKALL